MIKNFKYGISLIVLVITILVIIVLAGAVILTVVNNNPLNTANEAVFKSDMKSALSELSVLNANNILLDEKDKLTDAKLQLALGSIKNNEYYKSILLVENNKLYILADAVTDNIHVDWAIYAGLEIKGEPIVPVINEVKVKGYIDRIDVEVDVVDSVSKIKEYIYYISEDGTNFTEVKKEVTKVRNIVSRHTFTGLIQNKEYYIKVKVVDNKGHEKISEIIKVSTTEIMSNIEFKPSPDLGNGAYTNQDVLLEVDYPSQEETVKKISLDLGRTWIEYTSAITLTKNMTVLAMLEHTISGQQGNTASYVMDKIDKIPVNRFTPTVVDVNTNTMKITGTATDGAATSDNVSSGIIGYQYRIDDGAWTAETTTNSYSFSGLSNTKTYKMSMRAIDKAGNVGAEESVTKKIASASGSITYSPNPNVGNGTYTNQNVTLTIIYPEIAGTTKKVSTNGGATWSVYTGPITITQNMTIHTLIEDSVENSVMTGQYAIDKIDKTPPSVPVLNYNSGTAECRWQSNINIGLTSTDTQSGILKYQVDVDNNGTADRDIASPFIPQNGYNSDNNRFRSVDKAGNVSGWSSPVHIHMDTQAPTHTNWWFGTPTNGMVSLYVQATDNIGIQRVQIPTSTDNTGYTNWQWINTVWDAGANAYRGDIYASNYGNYYGKYISHIYIYDHAGNGGMYAASGAINIPNPETKIIFNSPENVNRLSKDIIGDPSLSGVSYNSVDGGVLYQSAAKYDNFTFSYITGLSTTYLEFELGSFGYANSTPSKYVFTIPNFIVYLSDGSLIRYYYEAYTSAGIYYKYIPGGQNNNNCMVVEDSSVGIINVGSKVQNGQYAKYNVYIENNVIYFKVNNVITYQRALNPGVRIIRWDYQGSNAWFNGPPHFGAQDGRLKYLIYR